MSNTQTLVNQIVFHGTILRTYHQTELAMQSRLRALCWTLHQAFYGKPIYQHLFARLSEDEIRAQQAFLKVPAWLKKPPPGVERADYHPDRLMILSGEVQTLLAHCHRLHPDILEREGQLAKLAAQLPVWRWCEGVKGFSAYGLGLLIANTGALSKYKFPAQLWKRMGVGLVQDAEGTWVRQKRTTDKELALKMGYSPRRRSVAYNVGVGLINQNKEADKSPGPYRRIYDGHKAYQQQAHVDESKMFYHRRAARYMTKHFLVDLWCAWHDVEGLPRAATTRAHTYPRALAAVVPETVNGTSTTVQVSTARPAVARVTRRAPVSRTVLQH